jgi:DNA-binding transcriptional regulator YiaG
MKSFPWRCGKCRERAVNPVTLPNYSADLDHDGRKYHVVLVDFDVAQCEECGTIVLDDVANRRLNDALRTEAGLLQPSEIRAKREALDLTQKLLAGYLRIAEATLSRWETGAQIQQRSMDAFLRTFFEVPEARRFLLADESEPSRSRMTAAQMRAIGIDPIATVNNSEETSAFKAHHGAGEFVPDSVSCETPSPTNTPGLRLAA